MCSVMDCQKLSREACAHAAQNDRLPVQTVVQVLYYEQQRLRDVMDSSLNDAPTLSAKWSPKSVVDPHVVTEEVSILRRENRDLKFELVKMKMRLKEIEGKSEKLSGVGSPSGTTRSAEKPPLVPRKSFISSVSKKLGKIIRADGLTSQGSKGRTKPPKDRRHSIS